jgi:hypothetical protein
VRDSLARLANSLKTAFATEREAFSALRKAKISAGEKRNAAVVERMADDLRRVVDRLASEESKGAAIALAEDFVRYGPKAILLTGSQRGGDFLNNQLRGRWAENVVGSMRFPNLVIRQLGPSGAAMPGEEDHHRTVMAFKEITLLEGKRPDLIAFKTTVWRQFSAAQRKRSLTWPERILEPSDMAMVAKGEFGIEVKNSTWHYAKRREAGGGALSITVKAEEIDDIKSWEKRTGLPVLFFQVLFDEAYCMSFRRMLDGVRRGYVYKRGDHERDEVTGAGGKVYHRFHLNNLAHRCAKVRFPSKSSARVQVLADGNVIPHILFQPAKARDEVAAVVRRELKYSLARKSPSSRARRAK